MSCLFALLSSILPQFGADWSSCLWHSENVYEADTLLLFMHDLGSLKASIAAATLDVQLEKTLLVGLHFPVY